MAPSFDHALGQRLAQLIQQSGEAAFEAGVLSRRLQSQLQDLLGAETALLNPLQDLLQRVCLRPRRRHLAPGGVPPRPLNPSAQQHSGMASLCGLRQ